MTNPTTVETAYRQCRLSQDFPVQDPGGQFTLTKQRNWLPREWNVHRHDSQWLSVHPGLPVLYMTAPDEETTCFLVGHLVTESVKMLERDSVGHADLLKRGISGFEDWLQRHGGRFVAIYLSLKEDRIYLDTCGSLAVVFCLSVHTVASTNMLIPYTERSEDNEPLIDAIGISSQNKYFPFGLTPRHNVGRLLPNHYPNLKSWETVRRWPAGDFELSHNSRERVAEISEILGKTVKAFVEHFGGNNLPITAGGDSRMLLAASRASRGKLHAFTFDL